MTTQKNYVGKYSSGTNNFSRSCNLHKQAPMNYDSVIDNHSKECQLHKRVLMNYDSVIDNHSKECQLHKRVPSSLSYISRPSNIEGVSELDSKQLQLKLGSISTQQEAEISKNYILTNLDESIHALVKTTSERVTDSALCLIIGITILLLFFIVVLLITFLYNGSMTVEVAGIWFVVLFVSIILLAILSYNFISSAITSGTERAADIYSNYMSSEDTLLLLNNAATVYVTVAGL